MKPPTIVELERIKARFDLELIRSGLEGAGPTDELRNYLIGGDWVKSEELVRRLVRRCLELEGFIQGVPV